ncbi:MAG: hypothetical protein WD601_00315 [Pseudohongiellaceae bacterium]
MFDEAPDAKIERSAHISADPTKCDQAADQLVEQFKPDSGDAVGLSLS